MTKGRVRIEGPWLIGQDQMYNISLWLLAWMSSESMLVDVAPGAVNKTCRSGKGLRMNIAGLRESTRISKAAEYTARCRIVMRINKANQL